jgi:hypothetical protein
MTGMAEHADTSHADPATGEGHRHERPEDWGWHGSFGRSARVAGWISVVIICLLNVTTYYNTAQGPWIYGIGAAIVLILIRDRYRRKNAWREE